MHQHGVCPNQIRQSWQSKRDADAIDPSGCRTRSAARLEPTKRSDQGIDLGQLSVQAFG